MGGWYPAILLVFRRSRSSFVSPEAGKRQKSYFISFKIK